MSVLECLFLLNDDCPLRFVETVTYLCETPISITKRRCHNNPLECPMLAFNFQLCFVNKNTSSYPIQTLELRMFTYRLVILPACKCNDEKREDGGD